MALHILANSFHFQYGVVFTAPLLGILFHPPVINKIHENRKLASVVILLFIASGMSVYSKSFRFIISPEKQNRCIVSSDKANSSKKVVSYVHQQFLDKNIYATGGIIPNLFISGMKIYQVRGFHRDLAFYDVVLIEKKR
ncbi:MAG: hypothetical protein OHK0056_33140 [Bacteriovoracaceae bacterium]